MAGSGRQWQGFWREAGLTTAVDTYYCYWEVLLAAICDSGRNRRDCFIIAGTRVHRIAMTMLLLL